MHNHSTGTSTKHSKERMMFHVPNYTAKGGAGDAPYGICGINRDETTHRTNEYEFHFPVASR